MSFKRGNLLKKMINLLRNLFQYKKIQKQRKINVQILLNLYVDGKTNPENVP